MPFLHILSRIYGCWLIMCFFIRVRHSVDSIANSWVANCQTISMRSFVWNSCKVRRGLSFVCFSKNCLCSWVILTLRTPLRGLFSTTLPGFSVASSVRFVLTRNPTFENKIFTSRAQMAMVNVTIKDQRLNYSKEKLVRDHITVEGLGINVRFVKPASPYSNNFCMHSWTACWTVNFSEVKRHDGRINPNLIEAKAWGSKLKPTWHSRRKPRSFDIETKFILRTAACVGTNGRWLLG